MPPCADAVLVPLAMSAPTIAIAPSAEHPRLPTSRMCSLPLLRDDARVSRFRSSPEFAVRSVANFGIEGHQQLYDSGAALNPKFAIGLAAIVVRTSGSRHWRHDRLAGPLPQGPPCRAGEHGGGH